MERKKEAQKDKELLEKYRKEYCLSDEEGQKYVEYTTRLKNVMGMLKESESKNADPAYQKARMLKKLTIVEIEKLLIKALEKEKYIKLSLGNPEMDRYVIIPFTIQDANPTRKESESRIKLQKIFKNILDDTNWRLMSEGTTYRLGFLSGRLKGYEREDDLAELVRVKPSKNDPVMFDKKDPTY